MESSWHDGRHLWRGTMKAARSLPSIGPQPLPGQEVVGYMPQAWHLLENDEAATLEPAFPDTSTLTSGTRS